MKIKIRKSFLIVLISLLAFYLILIPFLIVYQDNGQVLALLNNIHVVVLFSIIISLIIILLHAALRKSVKLIKIERILILCLISGNLIFIFVLAFFYISFSSTLNLDSSLFFAIIGIVYVIFNGLFIIIFAIVKKKNIKKI